MSRSSCDVCHFCLEPRSSCGADCPSSHGVRRRDVSRWLADAVWTHGLHPESPLVLEALVATDQRREQLEQELVEWRRAMRAAEDVHVALRQQVKRARREAALDEDVSVSSSAAQLRAWCLLHEPSLDPRVQCSRRAGPAQRAAATRINPLASLRGQQPESEPAESTAGENPTHSNGHE